MATAVLIATPLNLNGDDIDDVQAVSCPALAQEISKALDRWGDGQLRRNNRQ